MSMRATSTILLVEDNAAIQEIVCDCFRAEGYCVAVATTFTQAVDALAQTRFGLVIADALEATTAHPQESRWTILEHIRQLAGYTPVVIFSAHRESDFIDFQARGFSDLVLKPFELDELVAVVRRHLLAADAIAGSGAGVHDSGL